MKLLSFCGVCVLLFSGARGQIRPLNFYKITSNEGLSQSTVNVMYKDKQGFLWIGTDDGLNRFDGKRMQTYHHDFIDTNTLAANEVYGICEDRYNRLWIAHYNAGISLFDKTKNRFIRLNDRLKNLKKL